MTIFTRPQWCIEPLRPQCRAATIWGAAIHNRCCLRTTGYHVVGLMPARDRKQVWARA
jgi:hypothetical protein